MAIRNAGATIQHARKIAKLTQTQLSEGICSPLTLSRIENNSIGVSASIFETLMSRIGAYTKAIPCFTSRIDFDCFYTLKQIHLYINTWQLQEAYSLLETVEHQHWANNKFYYQEWLFLHGKLQFYSGCCDHKQNYQLLINALQLTHTNIDLSDFRTLLLSINEIELLTLISRELLYLNQEDLCFRICTQLNDYLNNMRVTYLEKTVLQASVAISLGFYFFNTKQYDKCLDLIEPHRHEVATNNNDMPLLELTFLKGLTLYFQNHIHDAIYLFKTVLYSAHGMYSCYATICFHYLKTHLPDLDIETIFPLEEIPLTAFAEKEFLPQLSLSDGTFDLFSPTALTIGDLIRELRMEQNLGQKILCQGLCSTSKLSKIERNQLQPDVFLIEALLQRLGISERPFTFWANDEDAEFYTLKFKTIHTKYLKKETYLSYIKQMQTFASPKNNLQKQYIIFCNATYNSSPQEKIQTLFKALHCTLPNFEIANINNYRLSWTELSILNNIAHEYFKTETPAQSTYFFKQLMNYFEIHKPDILISNSVFILTIYMFCHSLYNQKLFTDILNIFDVKKRAILKTSLNMHTFFLIYYCQTLGECKQYNNAFLYGNYACAISNLFDFQSNITELKQFLYKDFSITLDF
ncbi:MAG: helix-turn-helix transcriptional regulator [Lachnospiraceae bacterium]|nr:helix-turn-helix transcriptional regulator [Lachnospiraceae bacterium]